MAEKTGTISSAADFEDDPRGWQKRWEIEIEAALKGRKKFTEDGNRIQKIFLDEESIAADVDRKVNLFTANIQTQRALLYGRPPEADVSRNWDDADDDVARVGAKILERVVNKDPEQKIAETLGCALDDRLLPGLGQVRVRYEADFESSEVPPQMDEFGNLLAEGFTEEYKSREEVPLDYVHWHDFLWSPARVWSEVRWVAFRAYLNKDDGIERFGELFDDAQMNAVKLDEGETKSVYTDEEQDDPWQRAEVWEIWDRTSRKVFWVSLGMRKCLDMADDPLELRSFFPCPRPMMANITSRKLMPRADYNLFQDMYREIDVLTTRMHYLEKALKVTGTYDAEFPEIGKMFASGRENVLIPVQNWANFSEKGAATGSVSFFPVEQVAQVLSLLREYRANCIELLYQATGMADIFRGASDPRETLGAQKMKSRFGGARMDAIGKDFARFCTEAQRLRLEVMAKQYDDETFMAEANAQFMMDGPDVVQQSLELIRQPNSPDRIAITSEALASEDRADVIGERAQFVESIAMFMQTAMPMAQAFPQSMPVLLQMMKWATSAFKGSQEIEGVLDQAIQAAMQNPEQGGGEEDAKAQGDQAKAQAQMQVAQMREQGAMQREQMKLQAAQQSKVADIQARMQEKQMELQAQQAADQRKIEHDMALADVDLQTQLEMKREELMNALREIDAELASNLELSAVDHQQDLEKIETDARLQSRYNPGKDTISGKGTSS